MAFQNKGSSVFEYGSHLPLIKLSGYTLCIEILIKKYLDSIDEDPSYSQLLLLLFHLVGGQSDTASLHEPTFNELRHRIESAIPGQLGQHLVLHLYEEMASIVDENAESDLFCYFESSLCHMIPQKTYILEENRRPQLSGSSLLGIFHRKMMICYHHASFATLHKFVNHIKAYYESADDVSDLESSATNPNINVLDGLKFPYALDQEIYRLSKGLADHIEDGETVESQGALFEIMSDAFPDLPSTHYLQCVQSMKEGEYIASLGYLHKYFDFVASSFKMNWNAIINDKSKTNKINQKQYQMLLQQKRKKMQYSLLCRAMFYAHFGHFNLAIQVECGCSRSRIRIMHYVLNIDNLKLNLFQITEGLQRAQDIGDRTCVASSLFLLVELLSDQSGNVNLIKQIYENCIQNGEAIPSVHIGSLIGLSKWNLYHISIFHSKSRPCYLWEYFYFANRMVVLNHNERANTKNLMRYFGEIHSLKGDAWHFYGNQCLSSISKQCCILNHVRWSSTEQLYINIANYVQHHCSYSEGIAILKEMSDITNDNGSNDDDDNGCNATNSNKGRTLILDQMSLMLLLRQSIKKRDLKLAAIYQTRLAELIPSCKDDLFLYLEMMYFHAQIRFEHGQFMECSRIVNNLISLCNQRSLQSLTVPYYLFLSKVHLQCHGDITKVMTYILKAWSICKSHHFHLWLPECTIFLAKLHLKLNNIKKAFHLILRNMHCILRKNSDLICSGYVILGKCQCHWKQYGGAIRYFHIARIWCIKLMAEDSAFEESCESTTLLKEIYYFLARMYENVGDTQNRDKAAEKLLAIDTRSH